MRQPNETETGRARSHRPRPSAFAPVSKCSPVPGVRSVSASGPRRHRARSPLRTQTAPATRQTRASPRASRHRKAESSSRPSTRSSALSSNQGTRWRPLPDQSGDAKDPRGRSGLAARPQTPNARQARTFRPRLLAKNLQTAPAAESPLPRKAGLRPDVAGIPVRHEEQVRACRGDRAAFHTESMDIDVNRLRRRPPGPKSPVQLDQSLLSDLACDDRCAATRELLLVPASGPTDSSVRASPAAVDETLDAEKSWKDISDLQDELSMGVSFLDDRTIARIEAFVAAANFSGEDPSYSLAEEAFDDDPHTPRDELFAGGFRVRASFGPSDLRSWRWPMRRARRRCSKPRTIKHGDLVARSSSKPRPSMRRCSIGVRTLGGPELRRRVRTGTNALSFRPRGVRSLARP